MHEGSTIQGRLWAGVVMEVISSRHNPTYKKLLRLASDGKERLSAGVVLFDGISIVKDFISRGHSPEAVIFDKDRLSDPDVLAVAEMSKDLRQVVLASDLFKRITNVKTSPGIVCLAKINRLDHKQLSQYSCSKLVVALERVQDPGNLGTILRSCAAFGVSDVLLSNGSVDVWSPKAIRASMGACFSLNVYQNISLSDFLPKLAGEGYQILATTPSAKKSIKEVDLGQKTVWLFGNEGSGLSDDALRLATQEVKINQSDAVESLNLSMAVMICLYENYNV